MKIDDWCLLCYEVGKEHPEYLHETFKAFSAGVSKQADINQEKVSNMALALSMIYQSPKDKRFRKLAKERMIESGCFYGTPFEKDLLSEEEK